MPRTPRATARLELRVPPELVERVDGWCQDQQVAPSRTAAIVYLINFALDLIASNERKEGRSVRSLVKRSRPRDR
jgi:hypothetical protein